MFFNDILMQAGLPALSSLCSAALKSASPDVRRNMLSHIENGRISVDEAVSLELIFMLGDPEADIREFAADILSIITGTESTFEVPSEQLFLNTFYLGDVNAASRLAERMESQERATAFVYLCLTQSSFGPAKAQNQETPKKILGALYSLHGQSKIDFLDAANSGLRTYCSRRKCFLGLRPNEENTLRRALKRFIKGAKEEAVPFSEVQKSRRKRPSKSPNRISQLPHKHRHRGTS